MLFKIEGDRPKYRILIHTYQQIVKQSIYNYYTVVK